MAGGAMLGYWAMGRVVMASTPANMTTMASTQAKMGRSMKKLTMARRSLRGGRLVGADGLPDGLLIRRGRLILLRLHLAAWLGQLQTLDDYAVAGLESCAYDPFITDSPVSLQGPKLDSVVRAHDQGRGFASLVVADSLLRHKQGVLP